MAIALMSRNQPSVRLTGGGVVLLPTLLPAYLKVDDDDDDDFNYTAGQVSKAQSSPLPNYLSLNYNVSLSSVNPPGRIRHR